MNDFLEEQLGTHFQTPKAARSKIAAYFKEEFLKAGDFHTRQDHSKTRLSLVVTGGFRIYTNHDGKEVTQWLSPPGSWVCDLNTLVFNFKSRWNIQALSDAKIYSISMQDYQTLNTVFPEWVHLEKQFLGHCFVNLENRVHQFLAFSAEERILALQEQLPEIFVQFPQQYIASMLGMTPETFSRIRKKNHFLI